ncbi:helix-turn-helix domain-containing protein [Dankookia sp. P2]|uniref:helix-turn-helix domain-containing protein n=1 Tax=Dankookia sp. P2 TaxID=3423955 RepID=UPI003D6671AB
MRQLQNAIRNAVVMHDGERLEAAMLPAMLLRALPRAASPMPPAALPVAVAPPEATLAAPAPPSILTEPEPPPPAWAPPPPEPPQAAIEIQPLWKMERRLILAALEQTGQDVPRAASLLEINPSTIYRKLQAWRAAETPGG